MCIFSDKAEDSCATAKLLKSSSVVKQYFIQYRLSVLVQSAVILCD